MAQQVTLAKAAMAVFEEDRMVWNAVTELKAAKPAIRKVQVHFFAQTSLRPKAATVERFQFSLKQGYRQCPESAEGVAGYWRSNINWKRFKLPALDSS